MGSDAPGESVEVRRNQLAKHQTQFSEKNQRESLSTLNEKTEYTTGSYYSPEYRINYELQRKLKQAMRETEIELFGAGFWDYK